MKTLFTGVLDAFDNATNITTTPDGQKPVDLLQRTPPSNKAKGQVCHILKRPSGRSDGFSNPWLRQYSYADDTRQNWKKLADLFTAKWRKPENNGVSSKVN